MLPPRYSVVDNAALPGGFGAVVRVHDSFLDRRVMFKFMQDARNNQQLVNEVRGLSGARSKHVVEIWGRQNIAAIGRRLCEDGMELVARSFKEHANPGRMHRACA